MSTVSDTIAPGRRPATVPTARSTPRRHRERGRRERDELYAVLDEALICHLGVLADGRAGGPATCYGRLDDTLYLHGFERRMEPAQRRRRADLRHG